MSIFADLVCYTMCDKGVFTESVARIDTTLHRVYIPLRISEDFSSFLKFFNMKCHIIFFFYNFLKHTSMSAEGSFK